VTSALKPEDARHAGYGQFGIVEEFSEQEIRAQLETNLLSALWVTQAALPYLREQGSGRILRVSSISEISAFPNTAAYHGRRPHVFLVFTMRA
jgi:NAD(P)-dependent dehydrogenase (short-subunit alcohol dehydrogenase family)